MKTRFKKWSLTIITIPGIIGVVIGLLIVYLINGNFNISILLGSLIVAIIIISIDVIKFALKRDETPQTDERIKINITRYLFYTAHIFLVIFLISIMISELIGLKNIPLSYLWIIIIAYIFISGIGGLIISKK